MLSRSWKVIYLILRSRNFLSTRSCSDSYSIPRNFFTSPPIQLGPYHPPNLDEIWERRYSPISVPAEKVDLVDELATKVEELESSLNEEIERGIQIKKSLIESHKTEVVHVVCEGLTATQVEKIKSLAESVEFSTEDEYKNKLETIRENYFPSGTKRADENQLHEELGDVEDKKVSSDPFVNAVAQAISKTKL